MRIAGITQDCPGKPGYMVNFVITNNKQLLKEREEGGKRVNERKEKRGRRGQVGRRQRGNRGKGRKKKIRKERGRDKEEKKRKRKRIKEGGPNLGHASPLLQNPGV